MTRNETGDLLKLCQAYDHRPDVLNKHVDLWHDVLDPAMDYEVARTLVKDYYKAETRRIMPATVNELWQRHLHHKNLEMQTAIRDREQAAYNAGEHQIPQHVQELLARLKAEQAKKRKR